MITNIDKSVDNTSFYNLTFGDAVATFAFDSFKHAFFFGKEKKKKSMIKVFALIFSMSQ